MRAKGVDISKWQGGWEYQGNIDFIVVKATEGIGKDPAFDDYLPEVQKVPIRGAYHYFRTGYNPIQQAENFYNTIKDQGFHFLVVDYEKHNNTLDKEGEQSLREFWNRLESLIDLPIVLYTSPYVFRDNLYAYNVKWATVPLWMAHYNDLDPQVDGPEIFDATGWEIWQYSSEGPGEYYGAQSKYIDTNVYNGTVEDMQKWLGLDKPDPVPDIRAAVIHECIAALRELL